MPWSYPRLKRAGLHLWAAINATVGISLWISRETILGGGVWAVMYLTAAALISLFAALPNSRRLWVAAGTAMVGAWAAGAIGLAADAVANGVEVRDWRAIRAIAAYVVVAGGSLWWWMRIVGPWQVMERARRRVR